MGTFSLERRELIHKDYHIKNKSEPKVEKMWDTINKKTPVYSDKSFLHSFMRNACIHKFIGNDFISKFFIKRYR